MHPPVFLFGTLCHRPLLAQVLGQMPLLLRPARLDDHGLHGIAGGAAAVLHPVPGQAVEGLLASELSEAEIARLDYTARGLGMVPYVVTVRGEDGSQVTARSHVMALAGDDAAPFDPVAWRARWAEVAVETANDVMDGFARGDPAPGPARYTQMLVRAGSRLRARGGAPTEVRRHAAPGDVEACATHVPYANFFAVEEAVLRFRGFQGGLHGPVTRAAFLLGDAVTVLPYDPVRDRVMVVEQFRTGPFARGDSQPWSLEAVAGRIDGGESPEDAARRETQEETGLKLRELIRVANYYPSPGAVTEYLYSYIGLADLPDAAAGLGGLDSETEDIRAHIVSFERLMALIDSGEIENGPLILAALALGQRRAALRGGA